VGYAPAALTHPTPLRYAFCASTMKRVVEKK